MSMQNQWKLLSQLKDYLNKTNYDKNQISLSKDWLDALQKLTYSQLETIRKLSSDSIKTTDTSKSLNIKHKESSDSENMKLTLMPNQAESFIDNSTIMQQKIQQVITYKLNQIKSNDILYIESLFFLLSKLLNKVCLIK